MRCERLGLPAAVLGRQRFLVEGVSPGQPSRREVGLGMRGCAKEALGPWQRERCP